MAVRTLFPKAEQLFVVILSRPGRVDADPDMPEAPGIGTSLKKDVAGSDKKFSFCYPPDSPGSRHAQGREKGLFSGSLCTGLFAGALRRLSVCRPLPSVSVFTASTRP